MPFCVQPLPITGLKVNTWPVALPIIWYVPLARIRVFHNGSPLSVTRIVSPTFRSTTGLSSASRKAMSFGSVKGFGKRQLGCGAMAGFALDILDVFHTGMNVAVSHRFRARMAIDAIKCVFAGRKLGDWLVIILQAIRGLVGAGHKRHRAQVIIAAVMTGIALRVGDGSGQAVDLVSLEMCRYSEYGRLRSRSTLHIVPRRWAAR